MSSSPTDTVVTTPVRVRDQDKCHICLCIKVEPVTMPCGHEVCHNCYDDIEAKSNMNCPFCRKRLSNWSRKVSKLKQLVNEKRWQEIRDKYPALIHRVQAAAAKQQSAEWFCDKENAGTTNSATAPDEDEMAFDMECEQVIRDMAEPGEIRKEFEEQIAKEEEIRAREREKQEQLSMAFIRTHFRDENERVTRQRRLEMDDVAVARALQYELDQEERQAKSRSLAATERRSRRKRNAIESEHCYSKRNAI